MTTDHPRQIEMIPIDRITVINPRSRGKNKFAQIVTNISNLGLKKPITVARRRSRNGEQQYDLVCGQGRLEAYRLLGQTEVPAFVIEASKQDLLLMSLAENLARRSYTSSELLREIAALKDRGYSYTKIAKKTDLKVAYVQGIIRLLNKGEERLLRAVEKGQIPLTIAITISSSDDAEIQRALAEAYEKKNLRGKQLLRARQLIEERRIRGRGQKRQGPRKGTIDSNGVLRAYQKEMTRQRNLIKKAKVCETRLLFVTSAVKQLLQDENFVTLLRAEALDEMPQNLATAVATREEAQQ